MVKDDRTKPELGTWPSEKSSTMLLDGDDSNPLITDYLISGSNGESLSNSSSYQSLPLSIFQTGKKTDVMVFRDVDSRDAMLTGIKFVANYISQAPRNPAGNRKWKGFCNSD
ncbi:hypothetical protein M569_05911 [Genlisea aurea]|uniref:Uncharacterized protein n=1 Tax=Genlisea aurea TaxID=192259 RepID=S8DZV1_9LAMI|nr:hypothetical protein M569_05911 [Genlisea aurea]